MNNGIEFGDAIFFIDGKAIGTLNVVQAEIEFEPEPQERAFEDTQRLRFANNSYSGTLENVTISDEFKGIFFDGSQRFKLVAEEYNYPRGNRLPKKKRIRNKWIKKYHRTIKLENVQFN